MSINQIGILFDFLAGFLLAPEIFGEQKLIQWENNLKIILKRMNETVVMMFAKFTVRPGKQPQYRTEGKVFSIFIIILVSIYLVMLGIPFRLWYVSGSTVAFWQNVLNDGFSNE